MRLLLKNENGCTICVPIQESDSFSDLINRLFQEFGLEFDIQNFRVEGRPIENNFNVINYLRRHSDENERPNLDSQICRLCGDAFALSAMLDISLFKEKIMECLHLNVDSNNLLSKLVCKHCVEKLIDFKHFLDTCVKAEKKQLEVLKNYQGSCPVCNNKSSNEITFVSSLDYLNSEDKHKHFCAKSVEKTSFIEDNKTQTLNEEETKTYCSNYKKNFTSSTCVMGKAHNSGTSCCFMCDLTFKKSSELKDLVNSHLSKNSCKQSLERSFQNCYKLNSSDKETCERNFKNQEDSYLDICEKNQKLNKKNMYCDMCPRSFRSKKRLEFHIEFHLRGLNARKCYKCKKEYSSEVYLYNHIRHNHSSKKLFNCDICQKMFRNKSSLSYHLKSHESFETMKPFLCKICDKRFVRKNILQDHLMNRHGVSANTRPKTCFQCQLCQETFPNTNSGISHMEIHHSNEMNDKTGFSFNMQTVYKLFVCEFCDKCYSDAQDLREHRLRHSAPLRYQCKICNEEFGSFNHLRSHLDEHIADGITDYKTEFEVPVFYICEFCEKYFKSSHAFSTHVNTHLTDKKYTCQFCSKVFSSYSEILEHRTSHVSFKYRYNPSQNALRPFECQSCQKAFTSNSSLAKHIRVHTGEKPFECNICRKNFSQSSGLYTHQKIHSNDRPYQCDSCSKSFKLVGNYKQHMKRHNVKKNSPET